MLHKLCTLQGTLMLHFDLMWHLACAWLHQAKATGNSPIDLAAHMVTKKLLSKSAANQLKNAAMKSAPVSSECQVRLCMMGVSVHVGARARMRVCVTLCTWAPPAVHCSPHFKRGVLQTRCTVPPTSNAVHCALFAPLQTRCTRFKHGAPFAPRALFAPLQMRCAVHFKRTVCPTSPHFKCGALFPQFKRVHAPLQMRCAVRPTSNTVLQTRCSPHFKRGALHGRVIAIASMAEACALVDAACTAQ